MPAIGINDRLTDYFFLEAGFFLAAGFFFATINFPSLNNIIIDIIF